MWNPFRKRTPEIPPYITHDYGSDHRGKFMDPDTDPIYVTHAEDPSLEEDEMIMHTTIDPNSITEENPE